MKVLIFIHDLVKVTKENDFFLVYIISLQMGKKAEHQIFYLFFDVFILTSSKQMCYLLIINSDAVQLISCVKEGFDLLEVLSKLHLPCERNT